MTVGWLIGSWLFGPQARDKNEIFDPGAQEMPRFNQALRGVTIPILFGTNRVASNITWQKNFNVIRNETRAAGSGGGKFGGSGMGGKGPAKGGSGEISYEYKWDMMYHIGIATEPMNLFGGWLGGDRLADTTILNITGTDVGVFGATAQPNGQSLSFEDAFYHDATPTGGDGPGNWSHFQTSEDTITRWPYSAWVGFKQLYLGHNAFIPQLSWELGPGAVTLDFDSGFIDAGANNGTSAAPTLGNGAAKSANGTLFTIKSGGSGGGIKVVNLETGAVVTYTTTDIDTFCTDANLDPGSAYTFTSGNGGCVIEGTSYALVWGYAIGTVTRLNWAFALCRINNDGTLTALGGYQGRSNTLSPANNFLAVGKSGGVDEASQSIVVFYEQSTGGNRYPTFIGLPALADMAGGTVIEDDGTFPMDDRVTDATSVLGEYFGIHGSHRRYDAFGWFAPTLSGLGAYNTRYYFYIGKADIEYANDNPAAGDLNDVVTDNKAAYPNGFIGYVDLTVGAVDGAVSAVSAYVIDNASWVDQNGLGELPFADAGRELDGTTINDSQDYMPCPMVQKISSGAGAGGYVVSFAKSISAAADVPATGEYNRLKIFVYNPLNKKYTAYLGGDGATFDVLNDIGASDITYSTVELVPYWKESNSKLYLYRSVSGFTGVGNRIVISTYGSLSISGGDDVLPPKIIYEIMTNKAISALNIGTSQVDTVTYEFVLNYCDALDIRISTQYNREEDPLAVIDLLLEVYGGYLIDSGGKIRFGVQQFTEAASVTRTLDNNHLLSPEGKKGAPPVTIQRGAPQDTYNKVKVNYIDRSIDYKQNIVELNDEVSQDLYGVRAHEFPPQFVMSEKTAQRLAARTLWSNLYARNIYNFGVGWKDADLEPGDTVTLVDSHFPELQGGAQVRITRKVEKKRGHFDMQAVDEIQYIYQSSAAVNSVTQASSNPLFGPTQLPAFQRAYEVPKEFQGAEAAVFFGYRQLTPTMGARLYISDSASGSFVQAMDAQPYILSGRLNETLPSRQPGYMEENVEVYLMPASGFTTGSPTYAQTHALDDVLAGGRSVGAGLMWAGSEMMAYEGVNLLAQNQYRFDRVYRGWGGTHIHNHSSGDNWHKHGAGILSLPYNEDKIGTTFHYKIAPYNFAGVEYDLSSIDANSYQILGTYYRPQVPPALRTFIETPVSGTNSDDIGALGLRKVTSGGCDVTFEWPDASRDKGYGTGGYGDGDYGRFTTDITSHQWRVEVLSSDGSTMVRSTTVSTGHYVYTLEANSADFNAWAGDFYLRVTPYNDVGDALRSRTKHLQLFD